MSLPKFRTARRREIVVSVLAVFVVAVLFLPAAWMVTPSAQSVAPPMRLFAVNPTTGLAQPVMSNGKGSLSTATSTLSGHSHTTGATITLTATTGEYLYITGLDIVNCASATAVTPAAPTYITTTNLTGSPQYQLGSGAAAGVCQPLAFDFAVPLRATTAGTNVTFVLPTFATNQVVSVNVYAYSAL